MATSLATLKALIRGCIEAELLRVSDPGAPLACCLAHTALKEVLPKRLWCRGEDVVSRLTYAILARREQETAALNADPEFVTVCDQRLFDSIAHQEAVVAEWFRNVSFTGTVAL